MGNIPIVTSRTPARSLRTQGQISAYASDEAFGAGVGRAMQGAGQQVAQFGEALRVRQERKAEEEATNKVAQFDFARDEMEARNEVGPDGAGLQDLTLAKFDQKVEETANTISDDVARTKFRNDMQRQRLQISARSVSQEFTLDAAWSKTQAEASLMSLQNKIMSDPSMYDEYIKQGLDVLDTRKDIPQSTLGLMKQKWQQDSAASRFNGMLDAAKSVDDIDRASAELVAGQNAKGKEKDDFAGRDWSKELSPQDYESLLNKMGTARKAFVTKADADARAALDTIEERAKDVTTLIDSDELSAVGEVVKKSTNPVTVAKYARIVRDQDIIQESRRLPPAEQQGIINGAKGDPRTAFPGVPTRVSNAANTAASRFDVSASYLAMTAQKEYGQYFTRKKANVDPKFAPVALRKDVDLRGIRPDVADAASVAGQLFGAPLNITSGYRSQTKQDSIRAKGDPNRVTVAKHSQHTEGSALDISTANMSPADKGRLTGALVDAGFTAIGEYEGHIHADFREAVPSSFGDQRGGTWGGWTFLSPDVANALKERGYKAGMSAKDIKRSAAVQMDEDIDYGRGTSMLRDDGRPTTGVVGVMQFTPDTFLGIMRNPAYAARIGVDTSGMTDAQILELRKDPDVSMLAGAALGEANKKAMTQALGRSISDAELYMGHFLGSGGAIALIGAKNNQGAQSAAKMLPQAAAANKPIFYDKGGRERTVDEVYNVLSREYVAAPSKVAYDDVQTRQKVLDQTRKELKNDPVQHAADVGSHVVPEFSQDNIQAYGQTVRSIAEYYNIPMSDMKVLNEDALNSVKRSLEEGNVDDVLNTMTAIQGLGGDVAKSALKQLDEKDSVYAFAGAMQLETGEGGIASDIIRGQKRMNENKAIKDEVGATDAEMTQYFRQATGNALNEVSPKVRQDIQNAALAHYVETVLARGKGSTFDQDAYTHSVQMVMGGSTQMAEVNGEPTVLPPGIEAEQLQTALPRMTVQDWADQSEDGTPPRYVDGSLIDPSDLADEAKLRYLGSGQYKVQLDDGSFAVTGNASANGRLDAYIFVPKADRLAEIANRDVSQDNGYAPPEGDTYTLPEGYFGPMSNPFGNFDEYGRWTGPK